MATHQYIIRKYVMASSVADALRIAKKTPVHEVHIDNGWWERNANYNIKTHRESKSGFKQS